MNRNHLVIISGETVFVLLSNLSSLWRSSNFRSLLVSRSLLCLGGELSLSSLWFLEEALSRPPLLPACLWLVL